MWLWLTEPFGTAVVGRALVAGVMAACLCAVVGTWVVLRGSVFLGEAMAHGMLPGVAIAALLGGSLVVGALLAALAMALGVAAVERSAKLSSDTSIGLLLVGMLALGVILISRSQSFAVDLTGFLFGDVLAIRTSDLVILASALLLTVGAVVVGHRAFVAVTFDPRKAATLGLRPQVAIPALIALVAVAMVASFHVVGTLLVLGLLVAPPATALAWARSIPRVMLLAAVIGSASVYVGLLVSWHASTAGGATIAGVSVALFFCSTALSRMRAGLRRAAAVGASVCLLAGCAGPPPETETADSGHEEVVFEGARELGDPSTRLVLADPDSGATAVYDAVEETETDMGSRGPVSAISGDGRFAYLQSGDRTDIIDAGAWTFDHGDHYHYFAADPAMAGELDGPVTRVSASNSVAALETADGAMRLLDRERLGENIVEPPMGLTVDVDVAAVVPYADRLVIATDAGRLQAVGEDETSDIEGECRDVTWGMATRRAVVFGCASGAVRVTGGDGDLTATPMPFPPNAPAQRPRRMDHRDRADVFAGLTDGAVWVLNSRQRAWMLIPVPDAVATNTAGDGTVLVLYRDGDLGTYDVATRTETRRMPLFAAGVPAGDPPPVIEIDSDRAYVNNAAAQEVYEVDYRDGLRIARTFTTRVRPGLMVEAGR